ncbi:general amidase [Multifurca ochricompacta]|uniref:amidase n=1 Tax=Multifurca ochricompacta TaxID=376703 RepID=A0AAD4M2W3_9AGAM|nr:general amidase [Multifurca ochricompacta]
MATTWEDLAAEKKRRQAASIPKEWLITLPTDDVLDVTNIPANCGLLSPLELEITETREAATILSKVASGEWSSVQVATAFCKRAVIAHQVTNCLTEIFIDRALQRAAWLDEQLRSTGKVVGPLHGLPISLKDQISIEGLETTMGYASWVGKVAERDATLAEILVECGAVLYVRTNVPQTLMWPETYNLLFGRTVNPANRTLTCGGSSGGEGALLGVRGSILGVGSDIGGSIRIPAAMNGVYGFRPSFHRIPYDGSANSLGGQDSLPSVLGPLSTDLGGIKLFMQAVIGQRPWLKDPLSLRKHWDEDEYRLIEHGGGKKLTFGILWNDGLVLPHPPIIRALEITKNTLIAAGHEVIDWKPYKHDELYEVTKGIWAAAGDADYKAVVSQTGEPLLKSMGATNSPEPAAYIKSTGISAFELFKIQKKRALLRKEYLDYWQSTKALTSTGRPVDAIISPVAPFPPPPHGKNTSAEYTLIWNVLDYPACVFPVTKVDPVLDKPKPAHAFLSKVDQKIYGFVRCLHDSPETFKNAPVGLQLVGRSQEDEAVIAMTEIVDAALKATFQDKPRL